MFTRLALPFYCTSFLEVHHFCALNVQEKRVSNVILAPRYDYLIHKLYLLSILKVTRFSLNLQFKTVFLSLPTNKYDFILLKYCQKKLRLNKVGYSEDKIFA